MNEQQLREAETIASHKAIAAFADYVAVLADALRPMMGALSDWWVTMQPLIRAIERDNKRERRQRRHYFLTHGKHGMKRPKGRRNV